MYPIRTILLVTWILWIIIISPSPPFLDKRDMYFESADSRNLFQCPLQQHPANSVTAIPPLLLSFPFNPAYSFFRRWVLIMFLVHPLYLLILFWHLNHHKGRANNSRIFPAR
jgi:hypothetical protein